MVNRKIMCSFTSQLFPMETETSQSRILMDILHQAVLHHHCPHQIFQNLKIFQKTGRKTASLQDNCAQVVLHWEMHLMHQTHQCNISQQERTLENQPRSIVTNFTCKDTIALWISGFPMEIIEL